MTRWLLILACVAAGMMEVAAAVAFWLSDAKRAAQKIRHRRGIADCRLPIADCRLPIADCRLPIADCRLPIADCRLPIADCRLPIADCRLPIADCRLPIADCRLPILRQRRLRSSYSGWFVSCLFLLYYANGFCHRQKPLYPQKIPFPSFPPLRGGNDDNISGR